METIYVEVRGGVVTTIYSDNLNSQIRVEVVDHDDKPEPDIKLPGDNSRLYLF